MAEDDTVPYLNGEVPATVEPAPKANGAVPAFQELAKDATPTNGGAIIETDALVIGAGLSGMNAMHTLRKHGFKAKCFEAGGGFGGVWYWNRYPGARVDSEMPFYQLNIPEVYKTWNFSQRFPDRHELQKYMAHIDKTLGLSKDTYFNARVIDASWDESAGRWTIKTHQGHIATGKYLLVCTGLLHRTYTPDFPGMHDYKGEIHHSAAWPENWSGKGKKIGLIGAGATGVQITQELGKQADELTVFVRRPSYNLAMQQRSLTVEEQVYTKHIYPALFKAGRDSFAGVPVDLEPRGTQEVDPEERERIYNEKWDLGGFNFQMGGFSDLVLNPESNQLAYDFWRRKVCARLTDPEKQKIMAPEKKPYYFGTKRSPLEQDYYEILNQPNVNIHDLAASPLKNFTEKGLVMADGKEYEFDTIVLATGFDSFTGSLTQMGLKNKDGVDVKDIWSEGVRTHLGLTISGFPNMFMIYTPQSPTALSNGPTIMEVQSEIVVDMMVKLEAEGAKSIDATKEAEEEWRGLCDMMISQTLFIHTNSWWNAGNIPGKKVQNMAYVAGIDKYEPQCRAAIDGWKGFVVKS